MKKLLSTAMALVLIIGLLTGCSVESQGEKTESVSNQYYLYYPVSYTHLDVYKRQTYHLL